MDKILERFIYILPLPVLAAAALVVIAAWLVKETQNLSTYGQVLSTPHFQIAAFITVLGVIAFYGSAWILAGSGQPSFAGDERGVCVARFMNDTDDMIRTHTIEELRTELHRMPELSDVRVVGVEEQFQDHGEALSFCQTAQAVLCIWGSLVKSNNIVHARLSRLEQEREVPLPAVIFPDVDLIKTSSIQLLATAEISRPNPLLAVASLERELAREQEQSEALQERVNRLTKQLKEQRETTTPPQPPRLDQELKRRRLALVVGVSDYAVSQFNLRYASHDALAISDRLSHSWPNVEITTLVDANATQMAILHAARELSQKASPGDQLWFYFSGHAARTETGRVFLLPSDSDPENLQGSSISSDDLYQFLDRTPADEVVMVLDTSFAGAVVSSDQPGSFQSLSQNGSVVVLAATGYNQAALEDASGSHSLFTYALLEGIAGEADFNADGLITADDLFQYTQYTVRERSAGIGIDQQPMMLARGKTAGRMVLAVSK